MKRIYLYLVVILSIATISMLSTSCSKDDEPFDPTEKTPSDPDDSDDSNNSDDSDKNKPTQSNGKLVGTIWTGEYDGNKIELEFLNNRTMREEWDGMTSETKYEESDNKLFFEDGCVLYNIIGESCEFSIDGSKLKLESSFETLILNKKDSTSTGDDESEKTENDKGSDGFISTPKVKANPFSAIISGKISDKIHSKHSGKLFIRFYTNENCIYDSQIYTTDKISDQNFSIEAHNFDANTTYYFRLFSSSSSDKPLSKIYSFRTAQAKAPSSCTYSIDGVEYKMVKVTGLPSGDFYIMQTELLAKDHLVMNGYQLSTTLCQELSFITHATFIDFIWELRESTGIAFRLPTKEEWIYAAKGGQKSRGYKYSGSDDINEVAWYRNNYLQNKELKRALLKPNELGLYDMSGNFQELTSPYTTRQKFGEYVDGDMYGGYYYSPADKCTPESYEKQEDTAAERFVIPGNCAIRLVYPAN